MEPQGNFDFFGVFGQITNLLEERQAFLKMLQAVIVALRLRIGSQQRLEESGIRGQTKA
ncbi:hypothetical protein Pstr01_20900 [Pseudomonas straminea]|nr:hypothetical protein Pstr01_20900 [Pseudomonas straminea]